MAASPNANPNSFQGMVAAGVAVDVIDLDASAALQRALASVLVVAGHSGPSNDACFFLTRLLNSTVQAVNFYAYTAWASASCATQGPRSATVL